MAKKNNSNTLIRRAAALLASVVTFIFLFLEFLAVRTEVTALGEESVETEGLKFTKFLFNEDYEAVREEFGLTTVIMWFVFVLVILAVVITALALIMNKTKFSKIGALVLVVALVALFVVNFDSPLVLDLGIAKGEINITNITVLYFVALALSGCGLAAVATLKD